MSRGTKNITEKRNIALANHTEDLIPKEILEKKAETLKTLAHPVRLQIVNILMNCELTVGEILKRLGTKQAFTSQQLSILKIHGILKYRRNGHSVFYSLENNYIKNIVASLITED